MKKQEMSHFEKYLFEESHITRKNDMILGKH
jgi:hypothetical protein